jgi:AraC-like DNA-binding protein
MLVGVETAGPVGAIGFHHLMPGVWVMDVRRCSHKWVVFHETYSFCLPTWSASPLDVEWKYRYRTFHAVLGNTMLMEPGEIHANLRPTPVADFIVVQVQPSVMLEAAAELGWPHAALHIKHPHPETRDPGVVQALRQFDRALCTRDDGGVRRRGTSPCTCPRAAAHHHENLLDLVKAVIDTCAEQEVGEWQPSCGQALLRRAEEFLRVSFRNPYSLAVLQAAAGCKASSTLLHTFKQEIGITPGAYVQRLRVAEACRLMVSDPDATLDVVAREVGFGDDDGGPLFVRHFKRALGTTPGAFRAALRGLPRGARREFARGVVPLPRGLGR